MKRTLKFAFQKRFTDGGHVHAKGEIHFTKENQTVAVFGPSGSGKTTFLRWIAGLVTADEGGLHWDETLWEETTQRHSLPTQERRLGYVAQSYALFPHLTVVDNIAYGLRDLSPQEKASRVDELLAAFEIAALRKRKPGTLSGGQKQRVAFARALAPRPQLLLLDEPFSALDYPTRGRLIPEVSAWLKKFETPAILVTHDPREAAELGATPLVLESASFSSTSESQARGPNDR